MTTTAYVLGIVAPSLVLVLVVDLLRRGKMRERHAVWWLVFGVAALLAGIFPRSLETIAGVVGVELPINLVFFVSISVAFLVFLQHSAELTRLEAKTRALAERLALLELELAKSASPDQTPAKPSERRSGPTQGGTA